MSDAPPEKPGSPAPKAQPGRPSVVGPAKPTPPAPTVQAVREGLAALIKSAAPVAQARPVQMGAAAPAKSASPIPPTRPVQPSAAAPARSASPVPPTQPVRPSPALPVKGAEPVAKPRVVRPQAEPPKKPVSPPPEAQAAEPPPEEPAALAPKAKRGRLYVVAIVIMVVGLGLLVGQLLGWFGEEEGAREFRRTLFSQKKSKLAPATKLGVEYHFDRNEIVDNRLVESRIVGLAASGNLVAFDAESYALRGEKVLQRRATCLGPTENERVLVGIANGSIVRVAAADLAIERVDDVPGAPRWIGKRAKDGALVVAYQVDPAATASVRLRDLGRGRTYEVAASTVLFLDSKDNLWIGNGDRAQVLDLETGVRTELDWKGGWPGVAGFAELGDGQVWAFGGKPRTGETSSFVARVRPGAKPVSLYQVASKHQPASAPTSPITHVLEDTVAGQVIIVSHDSVSVTDRSLGTWKPLDALGASHREEGALFSLGQAHRTSRGGVLLNLARGGFMEITSEYTHRHLLEGQYSVSRPFEIVRLEKGMAFFGDGGPSFYAGGEWRALPDPIIPPAELLGLARPGEIERIWAAMLTIPLDGETSYVLAKAGVPRHYLGHIHGLRDTFLTARWDGKSLTTLGREDLPIEPADTFSTPDRQLWNVDDQGLWSFAGGHWRLVMRATGHGGGGIHASTRESSGVRGMAGSRSAVGEPLHFAQSAAPPFYGLPSSASSWVLVRLDKNDEGGIPLIDELPVVLDGRRLLLHDLTIWENKKDEFLLATDHGLCLFNVKWGTCESKRPAGLANEATMFMRDRSKRLWLAGRGLWVLRDLEHAVAVHPAIPMLADTRVVLMAEAADGRVVLGLEDRGTIFLTLPEGWLNRPPELPGAPAPWESTRSHEPSYQDGSLVLRACRENGGPVPEGVTSALLADLRGYAESAAARVRVGMEAAFEGRPDIVVRGADPEKLLGGVAPLLSKHAAKAHFAVWKRQGPRGSEAIQVRFCSSF